MLLIAVKMKHEGPLGSETFFMLNSTVHEICKMVKTKTFRCIYLASTIISKIFEREEKR